MGNVYLSQFNLKKYRGAEKISIIFGKGVSLYLDELSTDNSNNIYFSNYSNTERNSFNYNLSTNKSEDNVMYANSNLCSLVKGLTYLQQTDLINKQKLNYHYVTNMHTTFANCPTLVASPISAKRVKSMYGTYYNDTNLFGSLYINLNVNNMIGTFYNCGNIIGPAKTSDNVISMKRAYYNCVNLIGEPACGENVKSLEDTYFNCYLLEGNPANCNGAIVTTNAYYNCMNLYGDFYWCNNKNFKAYIINATNMFYGRNLNNKLNITVEENSAILNALLNYNTNYGAIYGSSYALDWERINSGNGYYYNNAITNTNIFILNQDLNYHTGLNIYRNFELWATPNNDRHLRIVANFYMFNDFILNNELNRSCRYVNTYTTGTEYITQENSYNWYIEYNLCTYDIELGINFYNYMPIKSWNVNLNIFFPFEEENKYNQIINIILSSVSYEYTDSRFARYGDFYYENQDSIINAVSKRILCTFDCYNIQAEYDKDGRLSNDGHSFSGFPSADPLSNWFIARNDFLDAFLRYSVGTAQKPFPGGWPYNRYLNGNTEEILTNLNKIKNLIFEIPNSNRMFYEQSKIHNQSVDIYIPNYVTYIQENFLQGHKINNFIIAKNSEVRSIVGNFLWLCYNMSNKVSLKNCSNLHFISGSVLGAIMGCDCSQVEMPDNCQYYNSLFCSCWNLDQSNLYFGCSPNTRGVYLLYQRCFGLSGNLAEYYNCLEYNYITNKNKGDIPVYINYNNFNYFIFMQYCPYITKICNYICFNYMDDVTFDLGWQLISLTEYPNVTYNNGRFRWYIRTLPNITSVPDLYNNRAPFYIYIESCQNLRYAPTKTEYYLIYRDAPYLSVSNITIAKQLDSVNYPQTDNFYLALTNCYNVSTDLYINVEDKINIRNAQIFIYNAYNLKNLIIDDYNCKNLRLRIFNCDNFNYLWYNNREINIMSYRLNQGNYNINIIT